MAAKKSSGVISGFKKRPKKRRKGVHAKSKSSKLKHSKSYRKRYVGQGK